MYFFILQCHLRITQCKFKRFQQFAQRWLTAHVSAEQQQQCNEWLLGSSSNNSTILTTASSTTASNNWSLAKTKVIVQNDLKKTPYRPYQRYKVLSSVVNNISINNANSKVYNIVAGTTGNSTVTNVNASIVITTTATSTSTSQSAAGVNLNNSITVTSLNATDGTTTTTVTNLPLTTHCGSVASIAQKYF